MAVERAMAIGQWSCNGLVGVRSVDWRWIGGGKIEGVGGRVAVVWWLNGGQTSGGGGHMAVVVRVVAKAI